MTCVPRSYSGYSRAMSKFVCKLRHTSLQKSWHALPFTRQCCVMSECNRNKTGDLEGWNDRLCTSLVLVLRCAARAVLSPPAQLHLAKCTLLPATAVLGPLVAHDSVRDYPLYAVWPLQQPLLLARSGPLPPCPWLSGHLARPPPYTTKTTACWGLAVPLTACSPLCHGAWQDQVAGLPAPRSEPHITATVQQQGGSKRGVKGCLLLCSCSMQRPTTAPSPSACWLTCAGAKPVLVRRSMCRLHAPSRFAGAARQLFVLASDTCLSQTHLAMLQPPRCRGAVEASFSPLEGAPTDKNTLPVGSQEG
jgi:hypothetical protein